MPDRPAPGVADPFLRGLACAALEPGLRSILVFDYPPAALRAAASQLTAMLQAVTGRPVERVTLGAAEAEDDLWGTLAVQQDPGGARIAWRPGRLVQDGMSPALRLVFIPDLARLSLPAARACVVLVGAEVATLQRHAQDLVWAPHVCWLAGCARGDVGEVSPHLLDRFALRLPAPAESSADRAEAIRDWATQDDRESPAVQPANGALSERLNEAIDVVQPAAAHRAVLPEAAMGYIQALLAATASPGLRRELALARLSRAVARLEGSGTVATAHVDAAADLLGLRPNAPAAAAEEILSREAAPDAAPDGTAALATATPDGPEGDADPGNGKPEAPEVHDSNGAVSTPDVSQDGAVQEPVFEPDTQTSFREVAVSAGPYPEDTAPASRDPNPLKLTVPFYRATASAQGPAIGTMRARTLDDLSVAGTILEAGKFQQVRPRPPNKGFLITRADLRSYRRAPLPEHMLVLLLDYTCLSGCAWQDALYPHLVWAYTSRARVCLIQVGAGTAQNRLRAEQIVARRLLSRQLSAALNQLQGTATPLAHGLDLAGRALRAAIQHGRASVQRARVVVLTDGRGNVPLDASRAGRLSGPVGRQGIDDALEVARGLRGMSQVETFLLNPQPQQLAELPIALAESLGATVQPIALREPAA